MEKHSTNAAIFDILLDGGYEPGIVTVLYGPAASGKTNLCLLAVTGGKKTLFIDTESSFSVERFGQLNDNYKEMMKNVVFLKPLTFEEQKHLFENLNKHITKDISLIIVDSITMLYRAAMYKQDIKEVNNDLNHQLNTLVEIARRMNIPVIVTAQVYSDFNEKDKVNIVGGDSMKYASKCMIELQNDKKVRRAIIKKHRSIPEGKDALFEIKEKGVYEWKK